MPWTAKDVDRHVKGLTAHQKDVWVNVANNALARGESDGTAVRMANAAAQRAPESQQEADRRAKMREDAEGDIRLRVEDRLEARVKPDTY